MVHALTLGQYSIIKGKGICKGFFWFEIFDSRIIFGKNILASIFLNGLQLSEVESFRGFQKNTKIHGKK